MDRRYKPLSPEAQLLLRERMLQTIADHPEWSVPEIVRYIRKTMRLTIQEMAKVGGLSVPALKNIEAGRSSPTLATVSGLLRPFGLHVGVHVARQVTAVPAGS